MKFTKYDGCNIETLPRMCSHVFAIKGDHFNTSNELVVGEAFMGPDGQLVIYPQNGREDPVECVYWCYAGKHPEGKEYKAILPAHIREQYKLKEI